MDCVIIYKMMQMNIVINKLIIDRRFKVKYLANLGGNEMSIAINNLTVGYGDQIIIQSQSLEIPKGKITCLIGPNGCGKSTLLKTIGRVLKPAGGEISLESIAIQDYETKTLAKTMAFLPQTPTSPLGLKVRELVAYGRFPHHKGFSKLGKQDVAIIDWALEATGLGEFAERPLEDLSGGQRQRAWIAMALCQDTEYLLLDEPTTYLDLAHQLEVLSLLQKLNRDVQKTIVMVIHELNQAARFADYMVGMKSGQIICKGSPEEVMTQKALKDIFNIDAQIAKDPKHLKPICLTYELAI